MGAMSRALQLAVLSAGLAVVGAMPAQAAPQASGGQQSQPAPPQGPFQITPIENTFVIAPIAKVTKIAGVTSGLAGFYAGKVIEDTLVIGGSAVWLANPRNNIRMWYAGGLIGWKVFDSGPLSVRAQALVGGGDVTQVAYYADLFGLGPFPHGGPGHYRVWVQQGFGVVEPELALQLQIVDRVRLNLGAGYRATTRAYGFGDELRGATGTIGVEFQIRR